MTAGSAHPLSVTQGLGNIREQRTEPAPRKWYLPILLAGLLAAPLAGCSVKTPLRVSDKIGQPVEIVAIELVERDSNSILSKEFEQALRQELEARGISFETGAALVGDLAIAARSSKSVISKGVSGANGADAIDDEDATKPQSRRDKLLDKCEAHRVRATLALFDRKQGVLAYRASAEKDICKDAPIAFGALAQVLADDLLLTAKPKN